MTDRTEQQLSARQRSSTNPTSRKSPRMLGTPVEQLEDRVTPATLTVHNTLDDTLANLAGDGELSLREAVDIANNPGTTTTASPAMMSTTRSRSTPALPAARSP